MLTNHHRTVRLAQWEEKEAMKRHNYFQRSFLVLISIFILSAVCAYGAEESITLTTYYPSPYGVYSEMRLYPKDDPTTPCQEGLMYYDQSEHRLMVCGQDAGGGPIWQPVSGLWSLSGNNLSPNDNAWNVGIGTAMPGTKLDVAGTVRATDFTCIDCLGPGDIGDGLGVSEIDETVIQRRVFDTCGLGSSIRVINQDGSVECEPDDGGGPGNVTIGSLTVTGAGGSMNPNPWNPGIGDATLNIPGGPGGGNVFSLTGGSGITLSGAGVAGNTWDPNAGTATINATGGGGAVTHWFSAVLEDNGGSNEVLNLGTHQFCALAYHWENTGGGGDDASCEVSAVGNQWTLTAHQGTDANVKCRAVCF